MKLLHRLKTMVGADDTQKQLHEYYCTICHTTFKSTQADVNAAACQSCGSTKVQEDSPGSA